MNQLWGYMPKRQPTGNPAGRPSILSEPVVAVVTVRVTEAMKDAWVSDDFRNKIRLYWEKEAKRFLGHK